MRSWRREDWFNKRLAAWVNTRLLGRGFRFRRGPRILEALVGGLSQRGVEHVIFSGDAVAMGFEEEMARAAELLQVGRLPGLAVPGNHDYCTLTAMREGYFERHFGPWQEGERVGGEAYPFAQRVGPLWLVGVRSATANRWGWDARGSVGRAQLDRLQALLPRLRGGPRVLVTHYPVWRASGRPEPALRGLRDLDDLLAIARAGRVALWLHGHRHESYHHPPSEEVPFPVICAGSATQNRCWTYREYAITGARLVVTRRIYDRAAEGFVDAETVALELPAAGETCAVARAP